MFRFALCLFIGVTLTGCGLSARQAQNLSDGLAGIEAVQPRVADDPVATAILVGTHDHVEAVMEGEALPPPVRTTTAIVADPGGYAADAHQAVRDARTIIPWWGWLAGVGAAALGVLRFIPGVGGAAAEVAWQFLAPSPQRQEEAHRDMQANSFQTLVRLIDGLPNQASISDLKGRITSKAPSAMRDAINQMVAEKANSGHSSPSFPSIT